jgi:signal transduction histidine kinase
MLVASLVAGAVAFVLRPSDHSPDIRAAEAFVAARFAERWDDPQALRTLATELHQATGLSVRLQTVDGAERLTSGAECLRWGHPIALVAGGRQVGQARLCAPHRPRFLPHGVALVLAFGLGLWWSSGVIARRLARPMVETAQVAAQIGHGALDARVPLRPRAPAEVQHMARAINDMAARVESAVAEQKLLLASVSHEIRTPLGHLRLLVDHAVDAGLSATLTSQLEHEVLEIDELVSQLLAGSKLDTLGPEARSLDAKDAAGQALNRAGEDAEKLRVVGAPRVQADPTLLARALANLLRNARQHGGELLSLSVSEVPGLEPGAPGVVQFAVQDAGAGLRPDELARLTRPFARDGADSAGSLGLGLTLVARIALAHSGRLRVDERGSLLLELPSSG